MKSYKKKLLQEINILEEAKQQQKLGNLVKARSLYLKILKHNKQHPDALHLLGVNYYLEYNYSKAIFYIQKAILIQSKVGLYRYNLALSLLENNETELAIDHLLLAIQNDPDYINSFILLGSIFLKNNQEESAEYYIQEVLKRKPNYPPALELQSSLYEKKGFLIKAKTTYQKLLAISPHNLLAANNLGNIYNNLGNEKAAEQLLNQVLSQDPNYIHALNNLGDLNLRKNKLEQAVLFFKKALSIDPNFKVTQINLAYTYQLQEQYHAALDLYLALVKKMQQFDILDQDQQFYYIKALIGLGICYIKTCQWNAFDLIKNEILDQLVNLPNYLTHVIKPFEGLILDLPPALQKKICLQYTKEFQIKSQNLQKKDWHQYVHSKIKVAYLSPDFNRHPVGLIISSLIPYHDKKKFEVHALFISAQQDEISQFLSSQFEHFHLISHLSEQEIIDYIQSLEIDILIDLSGNTRFTKNNVIAAKPAPIQCEWLGYASSLWNDSIDYFITTKMQVPEALSTQFSEKRLYLPQTMMAIDLSLPYFKLTLQKPTRKAYGLPEDKFIFCCFNQNYRYDKTLCKAWIQILKATPNGFLWISVHPEAKIHLENFFVENSIGLNRIKMIDFLPLNEAWHHQLADLYLDTFKESGATTQLFSWIVDLPTLSLQGNTPQSRMGSSLLHAGNLPDCVALNQEDYIKKAIHYANHPESLQFVKQKMRSNKKNNRLFQPKSLMNDLEYALASIWNEYYHGK